ncbi:MAG: protein translocase subunit SecDF, partial [Saprospiraceae bacterium]
MHRFFLFYFQHYIPMQGKGIFKFFLVIVTLVCILQYIFLLPTRRVEGDAQTYAEAQAAKISNPADKDAALKIARVSYLDSMSSEQIFSIPLIKKYTYEDLKRQQLALGLDLKGGMSTVLRVDLREFIISLSNNSKDPSFLSALEKATVQQKTSPTEFITLFSNAWNEVAGDKKLASIFSINPSMREKLTVQSTNAEVVRILREKASETVDLTFKRLKDRIDKFGVTQPNVSLDAARDLIVVELPGIDNPERARRFLQASAKLEFWDVYRVTDPGIMEAFASADKALSSSTMLDSAAINAPKTRKDTTYVPKTDSLGNVVDSTMEIKDVPVDNGLKTKGPLTSVLDLNIPNQQQMIAPFAVMGVADKNKKNIINEYLSREDVRKIFPSDLMFRWAAKPTVDPKTSRATTKYELYAIKKKRGSDQAPLEGDRVVNANANPDPITGSVAVSLKMDNLGAKIWGEMTTKAAQDNNREIAIVLDDEVVSAPRVNDPILSGDSQISGGFSIQEGKDLSNILQIGKLPAKTKIIQESLVGPSLGQENINKSMMSIILGLLSIIL